MRLNHIINFDTATLNWSEKIEPKEQYDVVLGSEVFYDEGILADIAHVLEQVLTSWGKGFFAIPIDWAWTPSNSDSKRSLSWQSKKIPLNRPLRKETAG
ncbi:MAG: hypothetical protein VST67_08540 [Nitrospirota bacterium]|nr:hypothetical protein [Nitrospirota bacterium]